MLIVCTSSTALVNEIAAQQKLKETLDIVQGALVLAIAPSFHFMIGKTNFFQNTARGDIYGTLVDSTYGGKLQVLSW